MTGRPDRMRVGWATAIATCLVTSGAGAQQPSWVARLGYGPDQVFAVRSGHLGMPFVQVTVADSTIWLLFDTGNMVGLTLATPLLDQLRLPESGRGDRLDADGRLIGSYRRVRAPVVRLLGRTLAEETIYEFSDTVLGGLVGPDALPGTRFTLDYRAGTLAVGSDVLAQLVFTVDYTRGRLLLLDARVP